MVVRDRDPVVSRIGGFQDNVTADLVHLVYRHRRHKKSVRCPPETSREMCIRDRGGIVSRAAHPKQPKVPLNGGPQMVEISRDGSRVYFTNSLYAPWDAQFYPDGIRSWMVKATAKPEGGMELDPSFFVEFGDLRSHQVRLEGGDASSDSYCYA